jgi:hypothetical protein
MEVGPPQTITFDPAAIPAGAKLSFGILCVRDTQEAVVALIAKDSFTCRSEPITGAGHGSWAGYLLLRS